MHHSHGRATLGGKLSAVLVAAGSSVGLGNIWRFPYVAGDNGGGAFLVIYILCVLLLGLPIMVAEFSVGRASHRNAVGAYRALDPKWSFLGYNGVVAAFLILGFYFVVSGWTAEYMVHSVTGSLARYTTADEYKSVFENFIQNPWRPVLYTALFVLATHFVIAMGVQKGIERSAKVLMPLLFIILIALSIHSLLMPGGEEGLRFLFRPDFSKVTPSTVLVALGQAFFSLSIGIGTMVTYASYFKPDTNLRHTALNVTILDTLVAVLAGVVIFLAHGRLTGHTFTAMISKGFATMRAASIVVVTFVLIGLLTTLWRAAGTVSFIVTNTAGLVHPHVVVLLTFLLNCLMSLLTGSSFASAATMGVITMTLGTSMQVPPVFLGGAILSGIYFGDRCSPVSTSAQLVKTLTRTNIFDNIRLMLKTAAVPFVLTCAVYAALTLCTHPSNSSIDIAGLFSNAFDLDWVTVLPAVVLVALAIARVDVRITMTASILTALPICVAVQHMDWTAIGHALVFGFHCADARVAPLIDGGGIVSMVKVMLIVCISSSYSGIFQETELLDGAHRMVASLARHISVFGATLVTSLVASAVACNQTLSIMLTNQLCDHLESDEHRKAINLEDTAVVVAPLIPWSIAGAVPLASVGAPTSSLTLAVFLYLLPIAHWISVSLARR